MEHNKRRKEDTMFAKISKVAAIITAVAIITGATVQMLSYEFVKKIEFKQSQDNCDARITKVEMDNTRIIQKLDDVGSDVKDIKKVLMHDSH